MAKAPDIKTIMDTILNQRFVLHPIVWLLARTPTQLAYLFRYLVFIGQHFKKEFGMESVQ